VLDGGVVRLSTIGRILLRLHRPLAGTPKTVTISRVADAGYAGRSCADMPTKPLPQTGRETGRDVGRQVVRVTAEGSVVELPFRSLD
jgi:putative transposase